MKPLPIQTEVLRPRPANAVRLPRPSLPVYPVMLIGSTLLAAVFCVLYLTKPVVQVVAAPSEAAAGEPAAPAAPADPPTRLAAATPDPSILPDTTRLPGDPGARTASPAPGERTAELPAGTAGTELEETNLKIQHVLSAESPEGELARIVIDVPVL